jgi:hypothetical protein
MDGLNMSEKRLVIKLKIENISITKQVVKGKNYDEIYYIIEHDGLRLMKSRYAKIEFIFEELELRGKTE